MKALYRFGEKARTALTLPLREKLWVVIFWSLSGLIRVAIVCLPFKALSPLLGHHAHNIQLSPLVSEAELHWAWRLGKLAALMERYTPWESKCLVQACLVRIALGFYRIPYVLHLGARLSEETKKPMKAHAWVKVGRWVVSGGEGHRAFGVVGSFVSPNLPIAGMSDR